MKEPILDNRFLFLAGTVQFPVFLRRLPTSLREEIARRGIVLLFPEVFRSHGGIQNVCRNQVHALIGLHPTPPLSVMVLNDSQCDVDNEEWKGVPAFGFCGSKVRFSTVSILQALRQRPAMLLLGHRNFLPLAPILKTVSASTSIWLIVHGTDAWPRLHAHERLCLAVVDRILSVSPDTARRFYGAGFKREIEILPNCLPHYWRLEEPCPSRFDHPVRLLAVARLSAFERLKGIDHTIEAVALMVERGMDLVFDVVGTGDDLDRLRGIAESLKVTDRVCFHGRVSDERLAELYREASIFVLPSGSEGFGLVYLEAMAYGKPVVAADVAGAPFVVRPGESGWLVPYGNPITLSECLEILIRAPESTRALGLRGRAFLERNFTYDQYVIRFLTYIGLLPEGEGKLASESKDPKSRREE